MDLVEAVEQVALVLQFLTDVLKQTRRQGNRDIVDITDTFWASIEEANVGSRQAIQLRSEQLEEEMLVPEPLLAVQFSQRAYFGSQHLVELVGTLDDDDGVRMFPIQESWVLVVDSLPGCRRVTFCAELLSGSRYSDRERNAWGVIFGVVGFGREENVQVTHGPDEAQKGSITD